MCLPLALEDCILKDQTNSLTKSRLMTSWWGFFAEWREEKEEDTTDPEDI